MKELLSQLVEGQPLIEEQTVAAFRQIMAGEADPIQVGAMLAMIQMRGPTVEELTGAARVMREKARRLVTPDGLRLVDTCGTGGDGRNSFNVSTATALVVAAAGRPHGLAVAKHGNRGVTSKSGSSQVLETLGVHLTVSDAGLTRCLEEAGICFLFAPAHHPAMKHAVPIRQALGMRTMFNLLGPLTNPAGAPRQVLGVFQPELTELLGAVLAKLGTERALVVHGHSPDGGLDELSIFGRSQLSEVANGHVSTRTLDAQDLGLPLRESVAAIGVDSPEASAAMIRAVLAGEPGPAREIVCLNAAAVLTVSDLTEDLAAGLTLAQQAIDSGAAEQTLQKLAELTHAEAA